MARSQYIYLIRRNITERVIAAFTVKCEAIIWAERNNEIDLY